MITHAKSGLYFGGNNLTVVLGECHKEHKESDEANSHLHTQNSMDN